MLRKEQNNLLTQTGLGTPMGQLFRSYWLPALLASELAENECPPVRVKLLSERLIAWRVRNPRPITLAIRRAVIRHSRRVTRRPNKHAGGGTSVAGRR
jgi:hypothetical protein